MDVNGRKEWLSVYILISCTCQKLSWEWAWRARDHLTWQCWRSLSHTQSSAELVSPLRMITRAQEHSTQGRLLDLDYVLIFFFFNFVCGCYTLLEHICFHCSGLLFFNPLSSLLRNVVLMHRKSLLTFCFVSFCFVFCLQKKIWGDICFHS